MPACSLNVFRRSPWQGHVTSLHTDISSVWISSSTGILIGFIRISSSMWGSSSCHSLSNQLRNIINAELVYIRLAPLRLFLIQPILRGDLVAAQRVGLAGTRPGILTHAV